MVGEPLEAAQPARARPSGAERTDAVLEEVGLGAELADRYPHELSGGQRQRVNIARALVTNPRLLVLDEPTSALDVSLRARVILLLEELRQRHGLSYLFISHDLATVRYLASRVAVMYLGVIVEEATAAELFDRPAHPYTRALCSRPCRCPIRTRKRDPFVLSGEIPSPIDIPTGCRLRARCPLAQPVCAEPVPCARGCARPFRRLPSRLSNHEEKSDDRRSIRSGEAASPACDIDEFEKFEREVDYVKAAQNPSIVSYRTHRIDAHRRQASRAGRGISWSASRSPARPTTRSKRPPAARNFSTCSTRNIRLLHAEGAADIAGQNSQLLRPEVEQATPGLASEIRPGCRSGACSDHWEIGTLKC